MASGQTPGIGLDLVGDHIWLNLEQEEAKGEPEKEKFLVSALKLTENELKVALYSKKRGQLFKARYKDHKEVVPDFKLTLDVISDTLIRLLAGGDDKAHSSILLKNDQCELVLKTAVEFKAFGKTIICDFNYRLSKVELSKDDLTEMRFGEIERALADLKQIVLRMREKDVNKHAQFDVSGNDRTKALDNGTTLWHSGDENWNTTPVNFEMSNKESFRARFQVVSHIFDSLMFGVVSNFFVGFKTFPGKNKHGWMVYFHGRAIQSNSDSYHHNGRFEKFGGGTAPFAGSIVTVEFFPQQGRIQYLVNDVPVGHSTGCTFDAENFGFAVSHIYCNTTIRILSVDRIRDDFKSTD